MMRKLRVMHFVTGGFSGATQVAVDLVRASGRPDSPLESLLVLRRKRQTPQERIEALRHEGLHVEVVPGWSHLATVTSLMRLCRRERPDVLVAHGFSEHLWGRYAGLWAGVAHLVHVEHNSKERYTRWRLAQAQWLAQRTDAIVGCSEGVRASLLGLGFPAAKTYAISNGIVLSPYTQAPASVYTERMADIVMTARFARQKDHATLIRATALLRDRGLRPTVWLAGGGSARYQQRAQSQVQELGLQDQVRFLGVHRDVPSLLMARQIFVLSSHYEGMPLALVEAMAAGCAVVGSAVPGVQEVIRDGHNGRLFAHEDAHALADILQHLLEHPAQAAALAAQGRSDAFNAYSQAHMVAGYEKLLLSLTQAAS